MEQPALSQPAIDEIIQTFEGLLYSGTYGLSAVEARDKAHALIARLKAGIPAMASDEMVPIKRFDLLTFRRKARALDALQSMMTNITAHLPDIEHKPIKGIANTLTSMELVISDAKGAK